MNRAVLVVFLAAATFSLGACGQSGTDGAAMNTVTTAAMTVATLGEQTILSPADYLTQDRYATADTDRGEILSMQCRACHSLEEGGGAIVGPNLFGVFGKTAGSAPGYPYSEALAASDFVWTPRALDAWLAQPFGFLPDNRMSFPGLPNVNDRNAVIAYLLQHTNSSINDAAADRMKQ